jgi:lipid-A-disaccharide synthase
VPVTEVDPHTGAAAVLAAFDVALSASGTASLEAALARAVPVVAYRVDLATQLLARALLKVEHVALPNVLLGRPAFPELLQRQVRADTLADAMGKALDDRPKLLAACDQVEAILGEPKSASREVARLLAPWL